MIINWLYGLRSERERRQLLVMNTVVLQTDAIVSSLFSSNFRAQMMQQREVQPQPNPLLLRKGFATNDETVAPTFPHS